MSATCQPTETRRHSQPASQDAYVRQVRSLLAGRYGYAPRDAALPHLGEAITRRQGAASPRDYLSRISGPLADPAELQALLEEVLNHETSFVRTPPHFEALRQHLLPALADNGNRRARLVSLGCSTGEEAYTMAAVAMDSPVAAQFEVTGFDISHRAIQQARSATYSESAIRTMPASLRHKLFEQSLQTGTIRPEVSRHVRFARHNLMDPLPLAAVDIVFCCNVLIYFSPENTRRVLGHIRNALNPGGWLFLGHAESALSHRDWFEPVCLPDTIAYRRRAS